MFLIITLLICGLWNTTIALITTAKNNMQSKIVFKVIPFLCGLACLAAFFDIVFN